MKNFGNTGNDKDMGVFCGMKNFENMRDYEDMGDPGGIKDYKMRKTRTADAYEEDTGAVFEVIEGGKSEPKKDPADVVTNGIMDSTLKQRLHEGIDLLEEREQTVLRLRYGLDGEEPQTLASIGEQIGVSRERVRQIDKQARGKLRRFISREATSA